MTARLLSVKALLILVVTLTTEAGATTKNQGESSVRKPLTEAECVFPIPYYSACDLESQKITIPKGYQLSSSKTAATAEATINTPTNRFGILLLARLDNTVYASVAYDPGEPLPHQNKSKSLAVEVALPSITACDKDRQVDLRVTAYLARNWSPGTSPPTVTLEHYDETDVKIEPAECK